MVNGRRASRRLRIVFQNCFVTAWERLPFVAKDSASAEENTSTTRRRRAPRRRTNQPQAPLPSPTTVSFHRYLTSGEVEAQALKSCGPVYVRQDAAPIHECVQDLFLFQEQLF